MVIVSVVKKKEMCNTTSIINWKWIGVIMKSEKQKNKVSKNQNQVGNIKIMSKARRKLKTLNR